MPADVRGAPARGAGREPVSRVSGEDARGYEPEAVAGEQSGRPGAGVSEAADRPSRPDGTDGTDGTASEGT